MLNTLEMERYIQATARRADLRVEWTTENSVPQTNGKVLKLPSMNADVTLDQYNKLRHFVTHEVNHTLYSDFKRLTETGLDPQSGLLGALWNGIEDHRIDYLGGKAYEGDRLNDNDVHGQLNERAIAAMKHPAPDCVDKVDTIAPVLTWTNKHYADFYPSTHRAQRDMEESLSARAREWYDKLLKPEYAKELRRCRTIEDKLKGTNATLDLAKRIYKEVYDGDPKAEMERAKQAAKDKAKGKKEEGGGQWEGVGGEGEDERTKWASVDYTDMMNDAHNHRGNLKEGMHFDYSHFTGGRNTRTPANNSDYSVKDYTKGASAVGVGMVVEINRALAHTSAGFAHKVRTILQIRDRDHYQYGLKRGHLHNSALYRVTMKDARGFNERVFKRKTTNDVLDVAITLVVDQSGSMGGGKFVHAAAAAVMLNDIVGNTLHIPVEIVSFTSSRSNPQGVGMWVHRAHTDRLLNRDTLVARFSDAGTECMSGNDDGDAIVWAFDRLIKRPEKRKLIVVFSDGSPSGTYSRGDGVWYLKHVVSSIEGDSPVDIVGIGLMDENVKLFYKEWQVIKAAHDLEPALLATIEGKLK